MQKMLRTIWTLCFMSVSYLAVAQDLPLDPQVRTGKLSNGLTYFIRKNPKPEKRVELRLAINAGSILEDNDQLGLAHFMEHMCFNGTKNFPKNELVNYLQSVGVRFGADLNAYTAFDETVYMLPIPSDKEEIVDKGLQILEDWAHNATLEGTEIDKERGVVIEEWRTRRGGDQRMLDKWLPVLFKDSRYAERLPIGTKENLETFKHETIRKFYKDWYRPDLMAVIVVGDIDVDKMEQKIKTYFGRMEASKNPRERKKFGVPMHKETYVKVLADKEATSNTIQLTYKQPVESIRTQEDYRRSLMYDLYEKMLNERLNEISQKPNTPYIFGYAGYGGLIGRGVKAYRLYAQASDENIERALVTLLTENKRVLDYGFNPSEFERAKQEVLRTYEKNYNERAKTNSDRYVGEYVNFFLEGEAAPGIEFEFDLVKKLLPTIKIEEVNVLPKKWITKENRVAIITASDKPSVKLPTEARVLEIIDQIDNIKVEKYEDKVITEPLMAKLPEAGKIAKETKLPKIEDVTEWTLSNGAKVVFKKTTFKDDEIRLTAFSQGGSSLYEEKDMHSATYAAQIANESGVGKFSNTDLKKMLAGKNVRVSAYIDEESEGMVVSTTPKDVETAFQLLHLRFTQPRKDDEIAKANLSKMENMFKGLSANPNFFFAVELQKILTQNNPRAIGVPTPETFAKVNPDRAYEIYKERFADAKDFTFVVIGNFEEAALRTLVEKYIASLPANPNAKPEKFRDWGIRPPKGFTNKEVKKGQDPKSIVSLIYTGELKNDKEAAAIRAFGDVLENKLIENLREDKGGVYSPQAGAEVDRAPYLSYNIQVGFSCAPENVEKLVNAVFEEVGKLQKSGPTDADMQKIKETYRREFEKNSKENGFWMSRIQNLYKNGAKPVTLAESQAEIEALTAKQLQAVANKYAVKNNLISVALYPEKVITEEKPAVEEKKEAGADNNSPADKSMTADKVIEKYIAAIGGMANINKIQAIRSTTTMEVMGMSMEISVARKGDDKMLMTQKTPQGDFKTIINGNKGVMITSEGTNPAPEDMVKRVKSSGIVMEASLQKSGATATLAGNETIDGKLTYIVQYKDADGKDAQKKWYSAETGLVVKMLESGREIIISQYEIVNGVKFPVSQKMKAQGMEFEMKVKVEVNPTLADELFKID